MSSEIHLKKYISLGLILFLIILAGVILKPIFLAIITGMLMAYIFNPLYKRIVGFVKEKNTSAFIILFLVFLILFLPAWFLLPVISQQFFDFFLYLQKIDLLAFVKQIFPPGVFNEILYVNLSASITGFVGKIAGGLSTGFSSVILNLPNVLLQALIVLFTLFFSLKDSQKFGDYVKSISPFTPKTEQRIMTEFKNITNAVIYGAIITSIIMGLLVGVGLFIAQVPHALLLTIVAIVAGILPILGIWMVWFPAGIYLIAINRPVAGILLLIYSAIVTFTIEGILRTYLISKGGKMHTAIGLIGMIGGLFAFGIIGFIIGPLILSYLLIIFEAYRNKELSSLFE
jgi:predicted PurR-regulated permease PerM